MIRWRVWWIDSGVARCREFRKYLPAITFARELPHNTPGLHLTHENRGRPPRSFREDMQRAGVTEIRFESDVTPAATED